MRATLLLVFCAACYAPPMDSTGTQLPVDAPSTMQGSPPKDELAPRVVCDMSKFSFTQSLGCMNDGWVEFCATKAGAPVVNQLRGIAPSVSMSEGIAGHAGCDETGDWFVTYPLQEGDCQAHALSDGAWDTLCALSQVPQTKRFVPGFGE